MKRAGSRSRQQENLLLDEFFRLRDSPCERQHLLAYARNFNAQIGSFKRKAGRRNQLSTAVACPALRECPDHRLLHCFGCRSIGGDRWGAWDRRLRGRWWRLLSRCRRDRRWGSGHRWRSALRLRRLQALPGCGQGSGEGGSREWYDGSHMRGFGMRRQRYRAAHGMVFNDRRRLCGLH